MGGFGSGRNPYADSATVEASTGIDITNIDHLLEVPGGQMPYRWRDDNGHGEEYASILIENAAPDEPDGVHLKYSVTRRATDETTDIDDFVDVTYTDCNFGGQRPWFRCPRCGDRVQHLYRPPAGTRFHCRDCHDLGYRSSRVSGQPIREAELRYKRAYEKFNGRRPSPDELAPLPPERPDGMHQSTYDDLVDELKAARRAWVRARDQRLFEVAKQADSLDHPAAPDEPPEEDSAASSSS
jgi:hypothetical protein